MQVPLLFKTGLLDFGPRGDFLLQDVLDAANASGVRSSVLAQPRARSNPLTLLQVELEEVSPSSTWDRFGLHLPPDFQAFYSAEGVGTMLILNSSIAALTALSSILLHRVYSPRLAVWLPYKGPLRKGEQC